MEKFYIFSEGLIVSPGFKFANEAEDWGIANNYHGILIQMIKSI